GRRPDALGARRQEAQRDAGGGGMSGEVAHAHNGGEVEAADGELARALEAYLSSVEAGPAARPEPPAAWRPASRAQPPWRPEGLTLAGRVEAEPGAGTLLGAEDGHSPASMLGDFRILRQVGRGGMGVVYEAEQVSLHRRVALKVLPFAAALDSSQLRRFQT